jgi:dynein heavy chain
VLQLCTSALARQPQQQHQSIPINRAWLPQVQVLSTTASKEASLEKTLDKMQADWAALSFRIIDYKDTGTAVVGGADEVQALLDDHLVKTQAMRASPYIKALEQEACAWEALLMALQVGPGRAAV